MEDRKKYKSEIENNSVSIEDESAKTKTEPVGRTIYDLIKSIIKDKNFYPLITQLGTKKNITKLVILVFFLCSIISGNLNNWKSFFILMVVLIISCFLLMMF